MEENRLAQRNPVLELGPQLAHLLVSGGIVREEVLLAVHVPDEVRPELGGVVQGLVGGQPQQLRGVGAVLHGSLVVRVVELQPFAGPAAAWRGQVE